MNNININIIKIIIKSNNLNLNNNNNNISVNNITNTPNIYKILIIPYNMKYYIKKTKLIFYILK